MKPILFNTEMVRAILDGRKTVTRRVVKPQPPEFFVPCEILSHWDSIWVDGVGKVKLLYQVGNILYVRETWAKNANGGYFYKADGNNEVFSWRPSIHMPKEATRIFLRVTDVSVAKLQDIDEEGAKAEGANAGAGFSEKMERSAIDRFTEIWNSAIPKHPNKFKRYLYYWNDNPWVWVIEFERISREEAYAKR